MNFREKPTNSDALSANTGKSSASVLLLAALVGLESLIVLAGAFYFFSQLFVQEVSNAAGAIVIFAITLLIAIGLALASIGTFRDQGWTKGAIITWQILQIAIATSFIRGTSEWQAMGWLLIVLSLSSSLLILKTIRRNS